MKKLSLALLALTLGSTISIVNAGWFRDRDCCEKKECGKEKCGDRENRWFSWGCHRCDCEDDGHLHATYLRPSGE